MQRLWYKPTNVAKTTDFMGFPSLACLVYSWNIQWKIVMIYHLHFLGAPPSLGPTPPGNASISRIRVSTSCPSRRRCSWTACHRVTVSPRLAWDGPFGMHIFMEVEIDAGNSDGNYGSFDHLWSNHPTKPTFVDWWSDGPRIRNQICVLMTILDYCFFDLWDTHTRVNFNFWSRPSNDL